MAWMKGWKNEMPKTPRYLPDEMYWDIGLIVQYWSFQPPNSELSVEDLGYKALSLFAVAAYPRSSDLCRMSRDTLERLAGAIRLRYYGTQEVNCPKFTHQIGIALEMCELICPARAIEDYIDRTADIKSSCLRS